MKSTTIHNNTIYSIPTFNHIKKVVLDKIIATVEKEMKDVQRESTKVIVAVKTYANSIGNDNIVVFNEQLKESEKNLFALKDKLSTISGSVINKMETFMNKDVPIETTINSIVERSFDKATKDYFKLENLLESFEGYLDTQEITLDKLKVMDDLDIEKINNQITKMSDKYKDFQNIEDTVLTKIRETKEIATPNKIKNINSLIDNSFKDIFKKINISQNIDLKNIKFEEVINSKIEEFKNGNSIKVKIDLPNIDFNTIVSDISEDLNLIDRMQFGEIILNKINKNISIFKTSIDEITGEIYDKKITIIE